MLRFAALQACLGWPFSGQPDVGSVVVGCYALMIVAVIRGSTLIYRLHCPRDAAHQLFSSQVARSWSFNVFRRCISVVRRVVGMTLLSFTDGATDFAVRSRRLTSLLTSSAVASPMVSVVPPTMTISLIVFVLAASSIISSISLKVAPIF